MVAEGNDVNALFFRGLVGLEVCWECEHMSEGDFALKGCWISEQHRLVTYKWEKPPQGAALGVVRLCGVERKRARAACRRALSWSWL